MSNMSEPHQEANRLRQEKKFAEAIPFYEKLWMETSDKYDGAGLVNCLRNLKEYDKAIPLAEELIMKFPDFQWGRLETIWTLIGGRLNKLDDSTPFENVLKVASEIMQLKPEDLAVKMVVFRVLKAAKAKGDWDTVYKWTGLLDPAKLSTTPMTDDKGRESWCDQALWYNYKVKASIEKGKPEEILQFIDEIADKFPKQKKFFLRLKASALHNLGRLSEAEECYKGLCDVRHPDWWLLHEYAKVIKDKGDKDEAFRLMCRAAVSNSKLDLMVALFMEMGLLCMEIGKEKMARAHLTLSSLVRAEQGWPIPEIISTSLSELNSVIGNDAFSLTKQETLSYCRKEWECTLSLNTSRSTEQQRKPRRGLVGKILLGDATRQFCFIKGDHNESYFCLKSDLPEGVEDGEVLSFTAFPSFDKRKNKESWKAADVVRLSKRK